MQLDQFALARLADLFEAEAAQRRRHRLALRVEDARLRRHMDAGPEHRRYWSVSGPFRSRGPLSGRMPRRRATSW